MKKYLSYITPFNGFILLSLYVLFVVPVTVFHYNSEEFHFSLLKYYWTAAGITAGLLLSAYFLRTQLPTSIRKLNIICMILGMYVFIVSFVFPIDVGALDGVNNHINELFTKRSILQLLGYLTLLFTIVLLFKFQTEVGNALVTMAILIGIAWVFYATPTNKTAPIETITQYDLLADHNALSKNKNILIFQFDALQGNFVYDALKEDSEYKQLLDGFTFFSNTNAVSPATYLSVPIILHGKLYAEDYHNTQQDTFEDNFLRDAVNSEFMTSTLSLDCRYASSPTCLSVHGKAIRNLLSIKSNYKSRLFYISLMRYIPTSLLSSLTYLNNQYKTDMDINEAAMRGKHYPLELDYLALQTFIDDTFVDDSLPSIFKYQMNIFTHSPTIFDKDCNFTGVQEANTNSAKEITACGLVSFIQLVNKLKLLKIYDNTLIILLSDHGKEMAFNNEILSQPYTNYPYFAATLDNKDAPNAASRYYATILYKGFNSSGDLKINNKPVSLLDIRATLCPYLSACEPTTLSGRSLEDTLPNHRKLPILLYDDILEQEGDRQFKSYRYLELEDHISELPYLLADLPAISFTDTLSFTEKHVPSLLSSSLIDIGTGDVWTNDKLVNIVFKINNEIKQKGAILTLAVQDVFISEEHPDLSVKLFVNNQQLATSTFNYLSDSSKDREIILDVPHTLVQDENYLYLRLEIDNPVSPFELGQSKNKNKLGLSLSRISLLEPGNEPTV